MNIKEFIKNFLIQEVFVSPKKYRNTEELFKREIGPILEKDKKGTYGITFIEIPKIGINPKSPDQYNTPLGIYFYPIQDDAIRVQFMSYDLPFAADSKYIGLFRFKNPANVVHLDYSSQVMEKMTEDFIKKVLIPEYRRRWKLQNPDEEIEKWMKEDLIVSSGNWISTINEKYNDAAEFWALTKLKTGSISEWTKRFIKFGVDGVVDYGAGIIHKNEPIQGVAFNLSFIETVAIFENPTFFQANTADMIEKFKEASTEEKIDAMIAQSKDRWDEFGQILDDSDEILDFNKKLFSTIPKEERKDVYSKLANSDINRKLLLTVFKLLSDGEKLEALRANPDDITGPFFAALNIKDQEKVWNSFDKKYKLAFFVYLNQSLQQKYITVFDPEEMVDIILNRVRRKDKDVLIQSLKKKSPDVYDEIVNTLRVWKKHKLDVSEVPSWL